MKKIIYLFLVLMITSQGCNYLRKKGLIGKKQQMKEYIQRLETALKEDSVYYSSKMDQLKKDSQAKIDSLKKACENSTAGYYVITGSFRNPANAQAFANKMLDAGYKAEIVLAPNGFNLVSAFSGNSLREASNALNNIRTTVAEDSWVYAATK